MKSAKSKELSQFLTSQIQKKMAATFVSYIISCIYQRQINALLLSKTSKI